MGSCCSTETKSVKIERKHENNGHQIEPNQLAKSESKPMTSEEVFP